MFRGGWKYGLKSILNLRWSKTRKITKTETDTCLFFSRIIRFISVWKPGYTFRYRNVCWLVLQLSTFHMTVILSQSSISERESDDSFKQQQTLQVRSSQAVKSWSQVVAINRRTTLFPVYFVWTNFSAFYNYQSSQHQRMYNQLLQNQYLKLRWEEIVQF